MINLVLSILISGNLVVATAPLPKGLIWECVYISYAAEDWNPAHCAFVDERGEIMLDRWPNMPAGAYSAQLKAWQEDGTEYVSNVVKFEVK